MTNRKLLLGAALLGCAACPSTQDQAPPSSATPAISPATTAAAPSEASARAPGDTKDEATKSGENAWCGLLKKGGEKHPQEAWFLRTAEVPESDAQKARDVLLCGAEGLKAANRFRNLTKDSEIAAAKPPQIVAGSDWCQFRGEAHSLVRVYNRFPARGKPLADPAQEAAGDTLGGVALLASLEGAAMSAQTSRVDDLIRKIGADGCEAVKRGLAK